MENEREILKLLKEIEFNSTKVRKRGGNIETVVLIMFALFIITVAFWFFNGLSRYNPN